MCSTRVTCCPLCFAPFPTSVIAVHASNCSGEKRTCRKDKKSAKNALLSRKKSITKNDESARDSNNEEVDEELDHDNDDDNEEPTEKLSSPSPEPPKKTSSTKVKKKPKVTKKRRLHESDFSSKSSKCSESDSSPERNRSPVIATKASKLKKTSTSSSKRSPDSGKVQQPPVNDSHLPLAEEMRPKLLKEFVGQEQILGSSHFVKSVLEKGNANIPNLILWGPPGCGKTSLANIIFQRCKEGDIKAKFVKLSACVSGINQVREVVTKAKNEWSMLKRKTILFIDEIHRFNKLQQDAFLPHVENGTIVLIGATTENPSFSLNAPLLSRCRVLVFEKLKPQDLETILVRSMNKRGFVLGVHIEKEAVEYLSNFCDGDARTALNSLQIAMDVHSSSDHGGTLKVEDIKECLRRSHILYDRKGDEHYHCASALQKSIRGSDDNAALYWTMRMLSAGEDPMFIARRLVIIASEDVGLGDPQALGVAVSAMHGCKLVGNPECKVILAQAAVYLARASKSAEVYCAMTAVLDNINNTPGNIPGVPLHLRNARTDLDKSLGYGKDLTSKNKSFMPEGMEDLNFFENDFFKNSGGSKTGLKKISK